MTNTVAIPCNMTDEEALREVHNRFPSPGPFLASFIKRFEKLMEYANTLETEVSPCGVHPDGKECKQQYTFVGRFRCTTYHGRDVYEHILDGYEESMDVSLYLRNGCEHEIWPLGGKMSCPQCGTSVIL